MSDPMNLPTVSLLCPLYNANSTMQDSLESIRKQDFTDYEVILVDDGSTDGSGETAAEVIPEATIVRLPENQGIAKALNAGLKHCKGKYIARIDCGDVAYPNRLTQQVALLEEDDALLAVGCHIRLFDPSCGEVGVARFPTTPENALADLLDGVSCICHSGAMIRTQPLKDIGGYDPFYCGREDFELWCRLSLMGKLSNVAAVLMRIRHEKAGISFRAIDKAPLMVLALHEREERTRRGIDWRDEKARQEIMLTLSQSMSSPSISQRRCSARHICKRAGLLLRGGSNMSAFRQYFLATLADPLWPRPWIGLLSCMLPGRLYKRLGRALRKRTGTICGGIHRESVLSNATTDAPRRTE